MREPFPLQWPEGWPRTPFVEVRNSAFYSPSFADQRTFVLKELGMLGARNTVITSNLPTRSDGLPYARANIGDDAGIAVWFVLNDQERVFACDRWRTPAENMRAIGLSIQALRGLERWGAGDVVTRAFAGFAALPPGPAAKKSWRDVLGAGATWPALDRFELLVLAKSRHRKAITTAHPDAGGSHELAAELNAALAEAEAELAGAG